MNKWKKQIIPLVTAMVIAGSFTHSVHAETIQNQRNLNIVSIKGKDPMTVAANVSSSSPGYTFHLLSDPVELQHVDQSYDFYYHVPKAELGDNNFIELVWSHSDLLIPTQSTLTVLVDDKPIKSIFLTGEQYQIQIPLQKEQLTPGYHQITVLKHSVVSDDLCTDQYNPGNWVKIEPKSFVFLDTKKTWVTDDPLKEFPHPFVERGTLDEVYGAIVLPDAPSSELIATALEVATRLASFSAGKKPMPIMTETEWSNASQLPHALALGSLESWTGPIKKAVEADQLGVEDEDLVLQNFAVTVGNKNESKQMLLVSAGNDRVIQEKIHVLTDSTLVKQLTGSKLVVKQTPKVETENQPSTDKLTFATAGYDHLLLDEVKSQSNKFLINIPSYWNITGESWLELNVKVSPLLMSENENSEQKEWVNPERHGLTVTINGIPKTISLAELKQINPEADTYPVRIPLDSYMQEKDYNNTFEISFTANVAEIGGACYRQRNNGRWIFIDRESNFDIPYEVKKQTSFKHWPAPFVTGKGVEQTALLVPQEVDGKFLTQLSQITNELVSATRNENRITVLREPLGPEGEAALKNHNLIVLGDIAKYPVLQKNANKLLIPTNQDQVHLSGYQVMNETIRYVAWIQPSIWNDKNALAVFQTTDEQAKGKADIHANLLQFLKTERKNSQIAIMSHSGEVFYIDEKPEAIEASTAQKETANEAKSVKNVPIWLWVLVPVILIVVLIGFMRVWRKEKKNRSE